MDKELFYNTGIPSSLLFESMSPSIPTWPLLSPAMEIQSPELNCLCEQSPDSYLNRSWKKSTEQSIHFDSALSSMISSPVASNVSNERFLLRELIGRLVNIGGGDHDDAQAHPLLGNNISSASMAAASYMSGNNSTNTSCYNTPMNSPPKLNYSPLMENLMPLNSSLMELSGDPGFAERAARFSCFGSRSFNGRTSNAGKIARVASSPSFKDLESKSPLQDGAETEMRSVSRAEFNNPFKEFPVSEQIPGGESGLKSSNDKNSRKRKAVPRGKDKEVEISQSAKSIKVAEGDDDSNNKRRRMIQGHENENGTVKGEEDEQTKTNSKPPEPLKDYVHVRARRGQATDSHSLAERVRREKIGERMKLLQDLVPGCNKVTGKALVLDEIINYVQSLQRQVEILAMKLASVKASVNFTTDLSIETRLTKDHRVYDHETDERPILRCNMANETADELDTVQCRNLSMQLPPLDGFIQGMPQFPALCEDDLQSLVQMGLARI